MNLIEATQVDIADGTLLRVELLPDCVVIDLMQFDRRCLRLTFSDWLYCSSRVHAISGPAESFYDMSDFRLVEQSPLVRQLLTSHDARPKPEEFLDYGHIQLLDCHGLVALEVVAGRVERAALPPVP
jgi:hypothetical protein